jgi:hypothetical protein
MIESKPFSSLSQVAPPTIKEIRERYPDQETTKEVKRKKKKKASNQDSINLLRQSVATTMKLMNEYAP